MWISNIELNDTLDFISCVTTYEHGSEMILSSCVSWLGSLSDEEIENFAKSLLEQAGFADKDYERIKRDLELLRIVFA